MKFWDTSALIYLLVDGPASEELRKKVSSDKELIIWWSTSVEAVSAFARSEREKLFTEDQTLTLMGSLQRLIQACLVVEPTTPVLEKAQRLVRIHPLRAADAFQLAAAIQIVDGNTREFEFVTLDKRLRTAALKEGFAVD